MRQDCIISPYHFNVYLDGVINEVKMGIRRRRVRFMEEGSEIYGGGREWRLNGPSHAGDLVLCGESEEVLRAKVGCFV